MLQMINSEHIKEIIFENCYKIYEWQNREKVLKYFLREKKKLNIFWTLINISNLMRNIL